MGTEFDYLPRHREADEALMALVPDCIREAAAVVGHAGMLAFFAGYKEARVEELEAA